MTTKISNLQADVQTAIDMVNLELQKRWLRPVKRKVYFMIHERLLLLHFSFAAPATGSIADDALKRTGEVLQLLSGANNAENSLWDVADALKELLIEVAPTKHIFGALVEERGRALDRPHSWHKYFTSEELGQLIADFGGDPEILKRKQATRRLVALYKMRNSEGRHDRAREGMRWRYLFSVSGLLLLATAGGLLLIKMSGFEFSMIQMGVVAVAGAVGAIVSGTIRLRDLALMVELKGAWRTLFPQMTLGATLALIVVLILKTGVIKIADLDFQSNDVDVAALFVIGLVGGWSEPFALGILEKVAALGR